jgi:surfeit locus 1 family protein
MLHKLKAAGLVWPTLAGVLCLALLMTLGTWQVQRKQWKDGLIAKIASRVEAEPVALERAEEIARGGGDVEYLHVAARGHLHHDKERYLYAPERSGLGWHVYTPLELPSGRLLWVNRGFVPDAARSPETRAEGQAAGDIEVRGLLRLPEKPGLFSPVNNAARNQWFWRDLAGMTASAFPGIAGDKIVPFALDADARPEPPGGLPKGGVTRIELPNHHLQYAVTWYGLALTLIGVYFAYALGRLRLLSGAR